MRHGWHQLLRWSGYFLAGIVALLLGGWFLFVPQPSEPAYEFVTAWGGQGSGPGEFHDPTGIAIAGDEVFVADARNGRIQVFDLEGHFLRQFGSPGEGPGELGRPMNLDVHAGELYVPEYFNDRIQVFSLAGRHRRFIGQAGDGPGQFNAPGGVAVAADGTLYVADFYGHRVQKLTTDGEFIRQWGTTGRSGHAAGRFTYPTDVTLGRSEQRLFIADGYGYRIQAFSVDGTFLHKWGGPFALGISGPFNGWFRTLSSIATGPDGTLFATDFYNNRVQKFKPEGRFLTAFGESGSGSGQFNHPLGVAVANDGSVFVTDLLNHRIQKWQPPGPRRVSD